MSNEHRQFGRAKNLLTKKNTGRLFGREGYDPFNKVSHNQFGKDKTLLTNYHITADCLEGKRTFSQSKTRAWTVC